MWCREGEGAISKVHSPVIWVVAKCMTQSGTPTLGGGRGQLSIEQVTSSQIILMTDAMSVRVSIYCYVCLILFSANSNCLKI